MNVRLFEEKSTLFFKKGAYSCIGEFDVYATQVGTNGESESTICIHRTRETIIVVLPDVDDPMF
jgi:hypothetical protein